MALPQVPDWTPREPDANARRAQKLHRLPAEERDLRKLAISGYWFCMGCKEITKRDDQECCVLCKSSRVEWQAPVFEEAAA